MKLNEPALPRSQSVWTLPIGSTVRIGSGDDSFTGTILAVIVRGPKAAVEYHVCWWNGRARVTEWLSAAEVEPGNALAMRIGFDQPKPEPQQEHLLRVIDTNGCVNPHELVLAMVTPVTPGQDDAR